MSKVNLVADDGRWTLVLNDPDRRNSIDAQMREELVDAVAQVRADPHARTLVIAGEGTSFCAGADLPAIFGDADRPVAQIRRDLQEVYACFLSILDLPIPTIAAVQGPAVGAGLNLALCCDIRIAGPDASFAATFSRIGLHPGGGCTYFLVQALGVQRAMAILLDGSTIDAREAVDVGLALRLADDPFATATDMSVRYAHLEPDLSRDIKRSVRTAARGDLDATIDLESWAQASSAKGPRLAAYVAKFRKP